MTALEVQHFDVQRPTNILTLQVQTNNMIEPDFFILRFQF